MCDFALLNFGGKVDLFPNFRTEINCGYMSARIPSLNVPVGTVGYWHRALVKLVLSLSSSSPTQTFAVA